MSRLVDTDIDQSKTQVTDYPDEDSPRSSVTRHQLAIKQVSGEDSICRAPADSSTYSKSQRRVRSSYWSLAIFPLYSESPQISSSELRTATMTEEPKKEEVEFRVPTLNLKRPALPKSLAPPLVNASLDYEAPDWALTPSEGADYKLEVIKGGRIVENIDLAKRKNPTFVVIGRLPQCDIVLEHPSMSRFHCIMQYGEKDPVSGKGWYLYDMGSTHGSRKNKQKLPPKTYERVYVGHVMDFGGSTRMMTLHGPVDDTEPELNVTPSELKKLVERQAMKKKAFLDAKKELEKEKNEEEKGKAGGSEQSDGISWGMRDDSQLLAGIVDEQSDAHLMEDREQYYRNDPVKALGKFFEREGFDMEFLFSDAGTAFNPKWKCTIELPVDTAVGQALNASSTACSSKKDAQTQCALEACRLLDSHGILRQSINRNRSKQQHMQENDFYDSDEDTFYDRTGQIEEQRTKRRRRMEEATGTAAPEVDTLESLQIRLKSTEEEIKSVEQTLERLNRDTVQAQQALNEDKEDNEEKPKVVDDMKTRAEKSKYRTKLVSLKHEADRLRKLVKIATPVALPDMFAPKKAGGAASSAASASKREELMRRVLAAKKGGAKPAVPKQSTVTVAPAVSTFVVEKEEGDDDEPEGPIKGPAFKAPLPVSTTASGLLGKKSPEGTKSASSSNPAKFLKLESSKSPRKALSPQPCSSKSSTVPVDDMRVPPIVDPFAADQKENLKKAKNFGQTSPAEGGDSSSEDESSEQEEKEEDVDYEMADAPSTSGQADSMDSLPPVLRNFMEISLEKYGERITEEIKQRCIQDLSQMNEKFGRSVDPEQLPSVIENAMAKATVLTAVQQALPGIDKLRQKAAKAAIKAEASVDGRMKSSKKASKQARKQLKQSQKKLDEAKATLAARMTGQYGEGSSAADGKYAMWMPPTDQSGDGQTALHEKFGGKY
uniref:FHA domain-containing protein n=1 Tax=Steinernema glaseri TaxID=37863 RepID=A0A1I7Y8S5_9BILA